MPRLKFQKRLTHTRTTHVVARSLDVLVNLKYPQHSRAVISSLVLWKTFSGVNYMPATHVSSQRPQFSILIFEISFVVFFFVISLTMIAVKWGNDYFSIGNHPQGASFVCLFLMRCWQIFNYFFKGRISLSSIEDWKFYAYWQIGRGGKTAGLRDLRILRGVL